MPMIEISLILIGTSFTIIIIFLSFCYVKFYMEDRFGITQYKILKSNLRKEISQISSSTDSEFPIVSEVCEYLIGRIDSDFHGKDELESFLINLSMKFGDDSK